MYMKSCVLGTVSILSVQQTSSKKVVIFVDNLMGIAREELFQTLRMNDKYGHDVVVSDIFLDAERNRIIVVGDFSEHLAPYYVDYLGGYFRAKKTWRYTDYLYAYDGELGTRVSDKGARVDLTVWAPSANQVSVILYDKDNQNNVLAKLPMTKGAKGEWSISLTSATGLSISDYRGYYYHYEMERDRETVLTLDPYAKSLAAWNSDWIGLDPSHKVAKAAIVDTASIGNQKLDYAHIKGYTKREDAIIYEAHVRDFTSDPAIADDLHHPFGTFSAFIDKLDYLKDLGVTHIQLLPVMSYYFANEFKNDVCLLNYASSNTNYNWGYDPQSYFALTGMYSADPQDPQERIAEFKDLVHAIHERGMGVILDVVYNHTADLAILEDLEPNYYHFMEEDGTAKTSFGGGRPGTTHYMTRRLVMDSVLYWVKEFKVDGFRFDMMGDLDAQTVQMAYDAAKKLNPNIIMLGEGWISYAGDSNDWRQPADQTWMSQTDSVGSFSDDMRNLLKSGYPSEGSPAFLTGGARPLNLLFNNIKAQPNNFLADDPGDVVQYIAAHDNLTLHDVIAKSIHKDPSIPKHEAEIQRRLRLGNALILTSQGTAFIHSGQEYGRTKQFRDEAYRGPVALDQVPAKSDYLTYEDGTPFDYPYFISDSYDSTDAINHFDWSKATDSDHYPDNTQSRAYTKGLIHLRRSTDAFTLATREMIDQNVSLITIPNENGIGYDDLVIAYQTLASNGDRYAVFINADSVARDFVLIDDYRNLLSAEIIADGKQAGVEAIENPSGVTMTETGLTLEPLTATILRLKKASAETERTLYDEASGVSVILGAGERDDIKKIKVSHQETNDVKTPEVLKGTDYDLFDIQPTDNFGNVLAITKTARVILPIDAGKTVAQVFYLPENGQPQSLAFEEISRTVAGQTLKFVIFNTEHFSQYGIIYAQEATQSSSAMATQTSAENGVTPDDQAQASVVETTTTPITVDANLETLSGTDTADILPATGEKDGTLLSFAGVLSLASIALLELKRRKKSE